MSLFFPVVTCTRHVCVFSSCCNEEMSPPMYRTSTRVCNCVFQLIEGFIIPRAVDDVIIRQQATCPAAAPVSVLHTQAERMEGH